MDERESLIDAIAREESRLASLQREQERAKEKLSGLLARWGELDAQQERVRSAAAPRNDDGSSKTAQEKVTAFRSLFRGRADVFPKRWESSKTGKSGYSPACANEWVTGVCEKKRTSPSGKSRISCSKCLNQAFLPVDDAVINDHLGGRHTLGVYPLLEDETCYFLAADFDKKTWRDDVAAFRETCRSLGVPVVIERSRSGNGAHAWFFFTAPVSAAIARKMGCYLLTETMTRRHELSMDSYDRFFPNQDTMPRGGFGNLIALPLQHGPCKKGNSLFVDDRLEPFEDQWVFLANVTKMAPEEVTRLADEATKLGRIVGVRFYAEEDSETLSLPWIRSPRSPKQEIISGQLPASVRAVLSQRLFVEKAGLPSALLNRIKRLAAFQNPEFYKRQNMRLSTARTPRVIACAADLPEHIALPRGCRNDLQALLEEHGIVLRLQDEREDGNEINMTFQGSLTPLQKQAAKELLANDIGVFVAPPGVGKTVLGTYLIAERRRSTLILVHRQPLADQWRNQLSKFLGINTKDIGHLGGGKHKLNGTLDVAMIQSLMRKEVVDDVVATYGHVIVDECHHLPAVSFERVLSEVRARYIVGLTATPRRRDGHQPITEMQLGPVRYSVGPRSQAAKRPFEHTLRIRETRFRIAGAEKDLTIQEIYSLLVKDEARNQLIVDDVIGALEEGRSPILLTERRDHLEYFAERLRNFTRNLIVLRGGMKAKEKREAKEKLSSIADDEERLLLATGRYIGEGFDDARLDTLFLALPVSWKGTLVQYAGRLHRLHPRKTEVRIYDYVDRDVPSLAKMFNNRLRGYRAIGYAVDNRPDAEVSVPGDTQIEWDEEALRIVEEDWG